MQDQNQSISHFSERTDALAKRLRIPLRQLGQKLGLSPAMLFGYRSGKYRISAKAWGKLERAENALKPNESIGVTEEQAAYGPDVSAARAQLEAEFGRLLDVAERVDGALGWVRVQLRLHLRPEHLRALDPAYDPEEEARKLLADLDRTGGADRQKAV